MPTFSVPPSEIPHLAWAIRKSREIYVGLRALEKASSLPECSLAINPGVLDWNTMQMLPKERRKLSSNYFKLRDRRMYLMMIYSDFDVIIKLCGVQHYMLRNHGKMWSDFKGIFPPSRQGYRIWYRVMDIRKDEEGKDYMTRGFYFTYPEFCTFLLRVLKYRDVQMARDKTPACYQIAPKGILQ